MSSSTLTSWTSTRCLSWNSLEMINKHEIFIATHSRNVSIFYLCDNTANDLTKISMQFMAFTAWNRLLHKLSHSKLTVEGFPPSSPPKRELVNTHWLPGCLTQSPSVSPVIRPTLGYQGHCGHQGHHGGLRHGPLHVHQLQSPDHHDIQMLRTKAKNISTLPFE